MSLPAKLKAQFPDANFDPFSGNVTLQDDGNGPYIAKWDEALGPKPTAKEIEAMPIPEAKAVPLTAEARLAALEAIVLVKGIVTKEELDIAQGTSEVSKEELDIAQGTSEVSLT